MALYRDLVSALVAVENCRKAGNNEWLERHEATIADLMEAAPSGSGIDCGTNLDRDASNAEKLVFHASYHHMNDAGMYDGWTEHTITVKASLLFDIDLKISGRDRNQIKDYLHDVYHQWLTTKSE